MKNILFTLVLWLFIFTASAQQSWQVVGEGNDFPEDSGIGLAPGGGYLLWIITEYPMLFMLHIRRKIIIMSL
ncbi:MAG: hypothetical protein RBR78_04400 [Flavobacteriaceae bacterium]|jgi:hypothetical protein|nr:hypothetical protein [Flavobacteriaceae bacterium]